MDKVAAAVILQQWLDSGAMPVDTNQRSEDKTMEGENNIIELVDEQGQAVEFEHLMTVEHEGSYYIVLMRRRRMRTTKKAMLSSSRWRKMTRAKIAM